MAFQYRIFYPFYGLRYTILNLVGVNECHLEQYRYDRSKIFLYQYIILLQF